MKDTIEAFMDDKKLAIAGVSNNKDNFGRSIMKELIKLGYEIYPVNPRCEDIDGTVCLPSVNDLPKDVSSLILAVPAKLTNEIIDQAIGSSILRVWMIKGFGPGAYSEDAHAKCKENNIEVVYGFCPLMFFGNGAHKFHYWLRKTFGKLPAEYFVAEN